MFLPRPFLDTRLSTPRDLVWVLDCMEASISLKPM